MIEKILTRLSLLSLVELILQYIGLILIIHKSKFPSWLGAIPFINYMVFCKISSKPYWRGVWFFIPQVLFSLMNQLLLDINVYTFFSMLLAAALIILLPFLFFRIIVHLSFVKKIKKSSSYALLMTIFPGCYYIYSSFFYKKS